MERSEILVTILRKNELVSLLSLINGTMMDEEGKLTPISAIGKLDPREEQPVIKPFNSRSEARTQFNQAIATSLERGWHVAYQGHPLFG